jgi:hypothetical protein
MRGARQVPAMQVSPAEHARPHMPQFAASIMRSAHEAVAPEPQRVWPGMHIISPMQVPITQV